MEETNKNESLLLSKYSNNLPVPKIALGASTSSNNNNNYYSSSGGCFYAVKLIDDEIRDTILMMNPNAKRESQVPSLDKVLLGVSGAPLSQYNFYCYLREHWQAEDNLNFWLDVANDDSSSEEFEPSHNHNDSHSSEENTVTPTDDSQINALSLNNISSNITTDEDASVGQPGYRRQINEDDLNKSAKQIYRKYAQLNIFPEEHRITMQDLILRQGRHNPVVFASSKAYVYHIMNVIYFPKFVESTIDINLTQIHAIIALPLGMVCLTFGIALELYYIFMAWENRMIRIWGFFPLWLGWVLLQTAVTRFFPPLILFGVSEHKLFRFHRIKERAILKAHRARALRFIFYDTLVALISIAILIAAPPIPLSSPS
ncbi:2800_t:CDS:2 [Ambispora gerdemannii]|uniref:2800_t:CDS:1 n=1 Tax=Ambispora gerdemannii TaxID=144530 RepID=A0A9N9F0Y2_9GLOM|nr:2800_t:CDS:2 [Ambispora gerdemannii]